MLKGFSKFWIICGLLIITVILGSAVYLSRSFSQKPQTQSPSTNLQTAQPTPQPPQTSLQDLTDTTNWRTYNNSKKGYSIKYPPSFEVRSITEAGIDSVQFIFSNKNDSKITVSWYKKEKNLSFPDWVTSFMKNYENYKILERQSSTTPPPSSLQVISIDTSITLNNKQIGTLFVFIQKDEENAINFSVTNPAEDDSLRTIFNQMLTTFELL